HFSLHPWSAARIATLTGVLLAHAAVLWTAALAGAAGLAALPAPRRFSGRHAEAALTWLAPLALLAWLSASRWAVPISAVVLGACACAAAALVAPRLVVWYRRATGASRILALFMAFLLPALLVYPSVHFFSERSMRRLVETRYAVDAMRHPQTPDGRRRQALAEIDAIHDLPALVLGAARAADAAGAPR